MKPQEMLRLLEASGWTKQMIADHLNVSGAQVTRILAGDAEIAEEKARTLRQAMDRAAMDRICDIARALEAAWDIRNNNGQD